MSSLVSAGMIIGAVIGVGAAVALRQSKQAKKDQGEKDKAPAKKD